MPPELSLDAVLVEPGAISRPLCVGLDGTLVTTRLGWERLALLFRRRPWLAVAMPFWMMGGPSRMRLRLAASAQLDLAALPYRKSLIASLKLARESGRQVVLAAATDQEEAALVARHLGLFDAVYASYEPGSKSAKLRETLRGAFPDGFDYIGHSSADSA